jgi:hypothetical protein
VLEETDTEHVLVIDVITGMEPRVDTITQKPLEQKLVVHILYVLVVFIVVVLESVLDVMDVFHM